MRNKKRHFKSEKKVSSPDYQSKKIIESNPEETGVRLNKYIANSGICSRREADKLIEKGEVQVDGIVVKEMGYKVKPKQVVKHLGKVLQNEKKVYLLLNKPKGFISTTHDPQGRKTVMDLVNKACEEQVFPVGRLDRATSGLLLFTNDGDMAKKLTHPSHQMKKIYQVTLDKPLTKADFQQITEGIKLEDGVVPVDDLGIVSEDKKVIGIEIHVGKNRIVRRLFEHLGYSVEKLDRVMFGSLTKKDLPRGKWRFLSEKEVLWLK